MAPPSELATFKVLIALMLPWQPDEHLQTLAMVVWDSFPRLRGRGPIHNLSEYNGEAPLLQVMILASALTRNEAPWGDCNGVSGQRRGAPVVCVPVLCTMA